MMSSYLLMTNEAISNDIATRIKRYRLQAGYSQEDLSKKTGLSLHSISNIETGKNITFDNLIKVLRALGLINNVRLLVPDTLNSPFDELKRKSEPQRMYKKR